MREGSSGSWTHSVAFRQALVYALIFGVSVVALFGFFYWSTAGYMSRQVETTVEAEIRVLDERYRNQGLAGLTGLIRDRLSRQPAGPEIYLLAGPDYRPLIGNLTGWPGGEPDQDGWVRFRLGEQGSDDNEVRWASARVFVLRGGFNLLVGRDMQELEAIRETIVRTLAWGLGITIVMALAGGALMGRSMSNRVRRINDAIRRIMAGDLSQRMPGNDGSDEFDRLVENLNRMLDRIEGLMDGVRQVSDSIAHDLKTPLARLRNRLEELQRALAAEETGAGPIADDTRSQSHAAAAALRDADAILATFGALLRIARIEASARRESFAPVDLAAVVGDVAELYEPLAEDREQILTVELGEVGEAVGDRDLLFQAIANLVDNAIKYAPPGGRVHLSLAGGAAAERDIRVTVSDSGPGVSPADRDRVFERFWRADDSRSTPGSGLGLSLVQAVARLHGASVELADNEPGLKISLRLPAITSRKRA